MKIYSRQSSRRARGRSIRWVSWRCRPSASRSCNREEKRNVTSARRKQMTRHPLKMHPSNIARSVHRMTFESEFPDPPRSLTLNVTHLRVGARGRGPNGKEKSARMLAYHLTKFRQERVSFLASSRLRMSRMSHNNLSPLSLQARNVTRHATPRFIRIERQQRTYARACSRIRGLRPGVDFYGDIGYPRDRQMLPIVERGHSSN